MSTYNSAKNRQSETRSSAWAFLLVGCIGFVIILLALLGVIRLPFGTFPLLIMEVMFVIFLVIAGLSFKHAMNMLDEISKENEIRIMRLGSQRTKKVWLRLRSTPIFTAILFILFGLSIYCVSGGMNDPFMYFSF